MESVYQVTEEWDLELLVRLFEEFRGVERARPRMEWSYLRNPSGRPRVWVLTACGVPVGFTACHPRQVWVRRQLHRGLVGGDFTVAPSHRTLGPALRLRRAAKELVDSGAYGFLFSHPVPAMLPVHERVGHPRVGEMQRWALPLRAEGALESRVGALLGRAVAPAANAVLRAWRGLSHGGRAGIVVREVDGFGAEYDELDRALGESYAIIGRRDRAYLAWRFPDRPGSTARVLEARDPSGRLSGYLVLQLGSPLAVVLDVAYLPGTGTERALWAEAARRAGRTKAEALSFTVLEGFPGEKALASLGFVRRKESQAVICYGGQGFPEKALVEDARSWFMTAGDRDV